MFGNGAAIGMVRIITKTARRTILKDLAAARIVFFAAVAGSTLRGVAALLIATSSRQTIATSPTGFVWSSSLPSSFRSFGYFYKQKRSGLSKRRERVVRDEPQSEWSAGKEQCVGWTTFPNVG